MDTKETIKELRKLVQRDKLQKAFEHLDLLLSGSPLADDKDLLYGRFFNLKRKIISKTISSDQQEVKMNEIRDDLLKLIKLWESGTPTTTEESPTSKSKEEGKIVQNAEKIYNIEKIDKADFS